MEKERRSYEGDDEEDIKRVFPSLYEEIQTNDEMVKEEDLITSQGVKKVRNFSGHNPGLVDFICRCKSVEEAEEILDYLVSREEIDEEEYKSAKEQLLEEGLESFGPHREPGYYERA